MINGQRRQIFIRTGAEKLMQGRLDFVESFCVLFPFRQVNFLYNARILFGRFEILPQDRIPEIGIVPVFQHGFDF